MRQLVIAFALAIILSLGVAELAFAGCNPVGSNACSPAPAPPPEPDPFLPFTYAQTIHGAGEQIGQAAAIRKTGGVDPLRIDAKTRLQLIEQIAHEPDIVYLGCSARRRGPAGLVVVAGKPLGIDGDESLLICKFGKPRTFLLLLGETRMPVEAQDKWKFCAALIVWRKVQQECAMHVTGGYALLDALARRNRGRFAAPAAG